MNKLEAIKVHEKICDFQMCDDCGLAKKDYRVVNIVEYFNL